jgi:hypothetical protein
MRRTDTTPPEDALGRARADLQAGRDRITAAAVRLAPTRAAHAGIGAGTDGLARRTLWIGLRVGALLATSARPRRLAVRGATVLSIRLLRRGLRATAGRDRSDQE